MDRGLDGGGIRENRFEPILFARRVSLDVDRNIVVLASSGRCRVLHTNDAVADQLGDYRPVPPNDPLTTGQHVEDAIARIIAGPKKRGEDRAESVAGHLYTDGSFITLEVDGGRTHYVVASGQLPTLRSSPEPAEDGTIELKLKLPDDRLINLTIQPDHIANAEKAVALLQSAQDIASANRASRDRSVSGAGTVWATTWTYRSIKKSTLNLDGFIHELNGLGSQGWELVNFDTADRTIGTNAYVALLRRPTGQVKII